MAIDIQRAEAKSHHQLRQEILDSCGAGKTEGRHSLAPTAGTSPALETKERP